ncbi:hypothetical protein NRB20_75740 [Nocardia sp. RB20]|uniref:Uncharacterized protein n=1 Tax=Nocardia macrotermitis TaxID=2585198 RepID=A0A7K0DFI0_9NOCA|nr:hypothetical protein [Nocardia macrotermitis]
MPKVKPVGIYREMYPTSRPELPVLAESYTKRVIADRSNVVEYLREGRPIYDILEDMVDLVGRREWIRSARSLRSDGVWVWRVDSIFYLERYSLEIPDEFLEHARQRDYRPDQEIDFSDQLFKSSYREYI